jgi:uncharacterized protein (UPF0333 family)
MSANSFASGAIVTAMLCATCHLVVQATGRSTNSNAPTFAVIANTPGMTSAAFRVALQTSHRTMPNFVIKDDDADSIIA